MHAYIELCLIRPANPMKCQKTCMHAYIELCLIRPANPMKCQKTCMHVYFFLSAKIILLKRNNSYKKEKRKKGLQRDIETSDGISYPFGIKN
ncbi:hypothetical protein Lal_00022003 [Lupinus albus]|nr:hypothetical protein Lal_00022003 [Lupinus albus]